MRNTIHVKFAKLNVNAQLPTQGSAQAAGWDLYALEETKVVKGASVMIPTGLACAIPVGWEGQIRCRSSLGKKGMILPNGVGTIDSDYRESSKYSQPGLAKVIRSLLARESVLRRCCLLLFHSFVLKKSPLMNWNQQSVEKAVSALPDSIEERACNPSTFVFLAS